jgi:formylglycine-generating enzyme required for sulfatase activity
VALGEWHIYVEAYDPANVLIGTGSAMVTVRAGMNQARVSMHTPSPGARLTLTLSGVSVSFRYVPGGSFQRSNLTADVSLITRGYWMGETEVTQELFQAVMGINPSHFASGPDSGETQNRRPVEMVSWYDAIAFCNKLSLANGKDPVYSVKGMNNDGWKNLDYSSIPTSNSDSSTIATWNAAAMDTTKNGYRLPTDAEWMWAAMGADKTIQPNTTGWSKAFAGSNGNNDIDDYAWYRGNNASTPHQVGIKRANELGIHDMSGNVGEWCWDGFSDRVFRGGSWAYDASYCEVAFRSSSILYNVGMHDVGFRVVCP